MTAYLTDLPRVFRASAEHIQTYGCYRGAFAPVGAGPNSPTCMAGAINLTCSGTPFPMLEEPNELAAAAISFASRYMPGEVPVDSVTGLPDPVEHVARWNDDEAGSAAAVVARLLRLALDAEQVAREAALLCRFIAQHDGHLPCDWCQEDKDQYSRELHELKLAVAA